MSVPRPAALAALVLVVGPWARAWPADTTATAHNATDDAGAEAQQEVLLTAARSYLGYPYHYGGDGSRGVDCSGFVRRVYAELGYQLPRTSRAQADVGEPVDWNALAPGDLLFFSERPGGTRISHVGIAIGDGRMIHASTGRGEVVIDELSLRYYSQRRVLARRLLGAPFAAIAQSAHREDEEDEDPAPVAALAPRSHGQATVTNTSVGATSLTLSRTSAAGLRAGVARWRGADHLTAAPTLRWRDEALDLELGFAVPLAWRASDGAAALPYSRAQDAWRLLDGARLGRPDTRLYVAVGRELALSLGTGLLVRDARPRAAHGASSALPLHAAPAAQLAIAPEPLELGVLVNDTVSPTLLAARVGTTGERSLALGGAVDPTASSRRGGPRGGLSLDGALELARWSTLRARGDVAVAALATEEPSFAGELGGQLAYAAGVRTLAVRAALRWRGAAYFPALFGPLYGELRRPSAGPSQPIWDTLDELSEARASRVGWELSASAELTRRFALRASYADDTAVDTAAPHAPGGGLMLSVLAREVELSQRGRLSISGYLTYHQLTHGSLGGWLRRDNLRELLSAGLRLRLNNHLHVGASAEKSPRADSSEWSGLAQLELELPW